MIQGFYKKGVLETDSSDEDILIETYLSQPPILNNNTKNHIIKSKIINIANNPTDEITCDEITSDEIISDEIT